MNDEIAVIPTESLALRHELSVEEVVARVNKVHEVMRRAMVDGHHYGVIPGTPKPTLLKPGAELLCMMFRLDPQYSVETQRGPEGHLTITSTCTLWHVPTGQRVGSGMGSCSTREAKYAYRQAKRACPKCGAEQINKSKFPLRGAPRDSAPGWYCFAKAGGCGQEFAHDDPAIMGQVTGRVANEDLADQENTVLKMSNKRSLIAGVLNVTAASDILTQDLEDMGHEVAGAGGRILGERDTTLEGSTGEKKPSETLLRERVPPSTSSTETTEQEAARLFPQEDELRTTLVSHIKLLIAERRIPEKDRGRLFVASIGGSPLETADVSALQDLETACAKWQAK